MVETGLPNGLKAEGDHVRLRTQSGPLLSIDLVMKHSNVSTVLTGVHHSETLHPLSSSACGEEEGSSR